MSVLQVLEAGVCFQELTDYHNIPGTFRSRRGFELIRGPAVTKLIEAP